MSRPYVPLGTKKKGEGEIPMHTLKTLNSKNAHSSLCQSVFSHHHLSLTQSSPIKVKNSSSFSGIGLDMAFVDMGARRHGFLLSSGDWMERRGCKKVG